MFTNFLRIAIRQFRSNKVYSLINVFGLSLGLGCFILLALFVNREANFDKFHANTDRVYQLYVADSAEVNGPFRYSTGAPMGPALQEEVPEITSFTRFGSGPRLNIVTDSKSFELKKLYYTDAATFDLFDIDIIAGVGPGEIFSKKHMLISETEAMRLYDGANSAIGQIIEVPDLENLEVIGVYKDLPENSHLEFNSLVSFDHVKELVFYGSPYTINVDAYKWGQLSAFSTFVMVDDKVDMEAIAQKSQATMQPHLGQKEVKYIRLDDIYLSEWYKGSFKEAGDKKELNLFIGVGLVLLLIAIVNYMNLSTARFSKRAKEVGVRKTIGGHRNQLVLQFLVESLTVTALALVVGVVFAEIAMPYFNGYTGKEIDVDYASWQTYGFLGATLLIIGFIAGIYPAFYLSKFSAKQSLRLSGGGKDKSTFRKVLVGIQFSICLGLMSATYILFSQHQFMNEIDLGMDTDQVMVIEMKGEKLKDAVKSVKGEIEMSSNIDFVKAANISPLSGGTVNMGITAGEKEVDASVMVVESGLMKMLNVKLDEGELFSDLPASDRKKKVLVNEAFVREAGLEEPIGSQVFGASTIIGVVKDFIYESAKKEIQPVMIVLADNANSYLYVHVSGNVSDGLKDVEKAITNFDPNYVFEYEFIDDVFAAKYEDEKRLSQVFGLFSILTIFIAGLGILGLSIFIAESRMKEIGIRKVLGAKIGQVVWLLNSGITALVMLVALITLPLVFHYTSGWLDGFAFRIELNPFHFILPLITLLGVLWSILFYQAYKSARSNPVNALRME